MNLEYSEAIESFLIEIQEYDNFLDFEIDDDRYVLKICVEILCDYCVVKKSCDRVFGNTMHANFSLEEINDFKEKYPEYLI